MLSWSSKFRRFTKIDVPGAFVRFDLWSLVGHLVSSPPDTHAAQYSRRWRLVHRLRVLGLKHLAVATLRTALLDDVLKFHCVTLWRHQAWINAILR